MAVADRWHTRRPRTSPDGEPVPACREHGMFPSTVHGQGDRWQVRWRDEDGKQCKRNFAKKAGADPERCAAAFDAQTKNALDSGAYVSPADANTTFREFAEDWRKGRSHDVRTADRIERELRIHTYPAIGHRTLRELAKRPTLVQLWIKGLSGADSTKGQIIRDVSAIFAAAMDDELIGRNPLKAKTVQRPKTKRRPVHTWTIEQIDAMAAELPARWAVVPYLGAGTAGRQGELFGLAVDDVDFLRREVHIVRQVRLLGNVLVFAEIKNKRPHTAPLSESLGLLLSQHIRAYPPVAVTLPWQTPEGEPQTHRLILTREDGRALRGDRFGPDVWNRARARAGIPGGRPNGMHVLRHTAATTWLAAGLDIAAVAEWLGDTVKTVLETYVHAAPDTADRGRAAIDAFFRSAEADSSALGVPSVGR